MADARSHPVPPRAAGAGPRERLRHFPVPFFALVMGVAGSAMAWKRAEAVLQLPPALGAALSALAAAAFVLAATLYGAKIVLFPDAVAAEFRHPVRINFFPTVSIALVLLASVLWEPAPALAKWLWTLGALAHFAFTVYVMNAWIHRPGLELGHVNPAWFIPVVGNIVLPIMGVRLYSPELSWFFFSVGIVFWLVLLTIVMHRLFLHAPLPERLTPTLFILVAPPAIGCVAYVALVGHVDAFARVLYSTALFMTLLLASNGLRFLRARFFLSAWAYSFPLAAVTIASLVMAQHLGGQVFPAIAAALLAVLTLVIAALLWRTGVAISRGEICVEER